MKFKFLSLFDAKTNIYKINQIKIKKIIKAADYKKILCCKR